MGDPATPTPSDRAQTRAIAAMWLDAVRNDEPIKFDIRAVYGDINGFITAVCQEVVALGEEREAMRDVIVAVGKWRDAFDRWNSTGLGSDEGKVLLAAGAVGAAIDRLRERT